MGPFDNYGADLPG